MVTAGNSPNNSGPQESISVFDSLFRRSTGKSPPRGTMQLGTEGAAALDFVGYSMASFNSIASIPALPLEATKDLADWVSMAKFGSLNLGKGIVGPFSLNTAVLALNDPHAAAKQIRIIGEKVLAGRSGGLFSIRNRQNLYTWLTQDKQINSIRSKVWSADIPDDQRRMMLGVLNGDERYVHNLAVEGYADLLRGELTEKGMSEQDADIAKSMLLDFKTDNVGYEVGTKPRRIRDKVDKELGSKPIESWMTYITGSGGKWDSKSKEIILRELNGRLKGKLTNEQLVTVRDHMMRAIGHEGTSIDRERALLRILDVWEKSGTVSQKKIAEDLYRFRKKRPKVDAEKRMSRDQLNKYLYSGIHEFLASSMSISADSGTFGKDLMKNIVSGEMARWIASGSSQITDPKTSLDMLTRSLGTKSSFLRGVRRSAATAYLFNPFAAITAPWNGQWFSMLYAMKGTFTDKNITRKVANFFEDSRLLNSLPKAFQIPRGWLREALTKYKLGNFDLKRGVRGAWEDFIQLTIAQSGMDTAITLLEKSGLHGLALKLRSVKNVGIPKLVEAAMKKFVNVSFERLTDGLMKLLIKLNFHGLAQLVGSTVPVVGNFVASVFSSLVTMVVENIMWDVFEVFIQGIFLVVCILVILTMNIISYGQRMNNLIPISLLPGETAATYDPNAGTSIFNEGRGGSVETGDGNYDPNMGAMLIDLKLSYGTKGLFTSYACKQGYYGNTDDDSCTWSHCNSTARNEYALDLSPRGSDGVVKSPISGKVVRMSRGSIAPFDSIVIEEVETGARITLLHVDLSKCVVEVGDTITPGQDLCGLFVGNPDDYSDQIWTGAHIHTYAYMPDGSPIDIMKIMHVSYCNSSESDTDQTEYSP